METENIYQSPSLKIIEIHVEKGFASSGDTTIGGNGENGGWENLTR